MGDFNYITPLIYPIFPAATGNLAIDLNIQALVHNRVSKGFTGNLKASLEVASEGKLTSSETRTIAVNNGIVSPESLKLNLTAERLSYLELAITADAPVFNRVMVTAGYALLHRPGSGSITVGPDFKYANQWIIQQIETFEKLCLLHTACYVDPTRNAGESLLFINPYTRPVVAKLASSAGRQASHRINPKSLLVVDLSPLLPAGKMDTIMLTANNRVGVYDLRHPIGLPMDLYSIDHLHIYSGFPAREKTTIGRVVRATARRALRRLGLRNR
jgi:hypothetical protein